MYVLPYAELDRSNPERITSAAYSDVYFQAGRGEAESVYVFVHGSELPERFRALPPGGVFSICELGFGTGLNFLLTWKCFLENAPPDARLHYVSIEKHPLAPPDLADLLSHFPHVSQEAASLLAAYPLPIMGFHRRYFAHDRIALTLCFGDAQTVLPQVEGVFDAWFLDGFAPARNPAMWQNDFYATMAAQSRAGATAVSFTAVGDVRRGLAAAGWRVQRRKGFAYKYHMTHARLDTGGVAEMPAVPRSVCIMGAGIAGASLAAAFKKRGVAVTVVERGPHAASGASGNLRGALYPKLTADVSPAGLWYAQAFSYVTALPALAAAGFSPCGVFHRDMTAVRHVRHRKIAHHFDALPDYCRYVDKDSAAIYGGAGSGEFNGGLMYGMGGDVDPRAFVTAMLSDANVIYDHTSPVDADVVVMAHGAWMAQDGILPLQLLRGQVTHLDARNVTRHDAVLCHEGYIPRITDGTQLIGATFDKTDRPDDTDVRDADHLRNLADMKAHYPDMFQGEPVITGGRAAVRAALPDRLPVAGQLPDGRWILGGLGSHGLTTAPLCAEIIVSRMCGEPLPVSRDMAARLMPARFTQKN